jgi:hypothetical protein
MQQQRDFWRIMEKYNLTTNKILLIAIVVMHLFIVLPYLNDGFPRGGDFFFNYNYLEKTTEFVDQFSGFETLALWNNDYNMGHPMFYYYQFLPYLVPALIKMLVHVETATLFKILLVVLYTFLPLSWYFCVRCFGFHQRYALLFVMLSSFLHVAPQYARIGSLTYLSYFQYGSYAFLFATGVFALGLGICWKYISAHSKQQTYFSKECVYSICTVTATTLSHVLLGFLLFFCVIIMFIVVFIDHTNGRKQTATKATIFLIFFVLTTSVVWFPAMQTRAWYGGLSEAGEQYNEGFGASLLVSLANGSLLDHNRLPLLTIFFFLGVMVTLIPSTRRRIMQEIYHQDTSSSNISINAPHTPNTMTVIPTEHPKGNTRIGMFLLVAGSVSFLFSMGILTKLAAFVGINITAFFPMGKFIVLATFFILFGVLSGVVYLILHVRPLLEQCLSTDKMSKKEKVVCVCFFIVLVFLLYQGKNAFILQDDPGATTIASSVLIDIEGEVYLQELASFMERMEYGTLYVGNKTSTSRIQQMPEILSWATKKPVLFASSGGFHETPSTTYTWFYQESMPIMMHMNNLFNIKYVIFVEGEETEIQQNKDQTNNMNMTEKERWYKEKYPLEIARNEANIRLAFANPAFVVYEQRTTGVFDVVHVPIFVDIPLDEQKDIVKQWLTTHFPLEREFLGIPFTNPKEEKENFPFVLLSDQSLQGKSLHIVDQHVQSGKNSMYDEEVARLQALWSSAIVREYEKMEGEGKELDARKKNKCDATVEIHRQVVGGGHYTVDFMKKQQEETTNSCFLIVKASAHPDWQALLKSSTKRDEEIKIFALSPNFMGVQIDDLDPGVYTVEFSFTFSWTRKFLLMLSIITLLSLCIICHPFCRGVHNKIEEWWQKE